MTRTLPLAFTAVLALDGCKVVDAPNTLQELMVFGFVHTTDEAEIQAVADELPPKVKRNLVEIEKGFRVDSLKPRDLRSVEVDPGDIDEIVGALGRIEYLNDLPDVLDAISFPHKDEIAENTTEYRVVDETDRACFLKGDCPSYEVTAEQITKQPIIGEITQTFSQVFVHVEHEGEPAVASRILAPDPVDVSSGLVAVDQQYSFFVVRQLPKGGCERVESLWAEARMLGADLPDSFLVDQAVNAMDKQAERVDAWIDGGKKPVE